MSVQPFVRARKLLLDTTFQSVQGWKVVLTQCCSSGFFFSFGFGKNCTA